MGVRTPVTPRRRPVSDLPTLPIPPNDTVHRNSRLGTHESVFRGRTTPYSMVVIAGRAIGSPTPRGHSLDTNGHARVLQVLVLPLRISHRPVHPPRLPGRVERPEHKGSTLDLALVSCSCSIKDPSEVPPPPLVYGERRRVRGFGGKGFFFLMCPRCWCTWGRRVIDGISFKVSLKV